MSGNLPYPDRLQLCLAKLAQIWVQRENFISDSNLLDVADDFAIDGPGEPDYDNLVEDMYVNIATYLISNGYAEAVE